MCGSLEKQERKEFLLHWVVLDGEYKTIECVGCEAELLGNKVTLKGQLYGFTSAMFRVRR